MALIFTAPEAPGDLKCSLAEDSVTVTWTAPNHACVITGYTIVWTAEVLWSDEVLDGNNSTVKETFTQYDVLPYTMYVFSVSAEVQNAVEGAISICKVQTNQTGNLLN